MGVFEMVTAIVMISGGTAILIAYMIIKARSDRPTRQGEEISRLRSELDRISQRVQVLEKLATDPAARLAADIDSLRSTSAH